MDTESTEALVARASRGDEGAFGRLVGRFERAVRSFVRSQIAGAIRGPVDVADLAQETFVRVHQGLAGFGWQDERAFQGWLLEIARNVIRENYRHASAAKRDVRREVPLANVCSDPTDGWAALLPASGVSPSGKLRREERFERLREALLELPVDQRKAIVLVRLEGLSLAEAGERLGRSADAASALLLRALKALGRAFGDTESFGLPDRPLDLNQPASTD